MGETPSRQRVKGEIVAFGKLIAALATMKRRDHVSEYDTQVYEERTAHIPLSILSRATAKILDTQEWFPTVAELLSACEAVRVEMRSALKHAPCEQCTAGGWTEKTDARGVKRMTRCACWLAHMEKVKALGVPEQPLALPAAREFARAGESDDAT